MKRLLFITHRVPYPPDKGERVRAFHEIVALAKHFSITLAFLTHSDNDAAATLELGRWCKKILTGRAGGRLGLLRGALSAAAGRSATEGFFRNNRLLRKLVEEGGREPFDLTLGYSSSTLPYVLAVPARARAMDLIDVDSAKWDAYAQAAHGPKRWLYAREARGVRVLEQLAVERCDLVCLVSEAERLALGISSDKVIAVSNGVDTEYFKPMKRLSGPPSIVFTGTMDYRPNIDGVCWFVRKIWPELRKRVPKLSFTIVGRDPVSQVCRLNEVPGVTVTGAVSDVRPFLAAASVAVVPLHVARGIQNKVLEAMAMGRAAVVSSQAIEGLEVKVGRDLLSADTRAQWAESILDLVSNSERRVAIEHAARSCVEEHYGWTCRLAPMLSRCEDLVADEVDAGTHRF